MILQTEAKIVRTVPGVERYPNMIKFTSYFNVINITQTMYMILLKKITENRACRMDAIIFQILNN